MAVYVATRDPGSAHAPSLLARPLHFPTLGPGARCPASGGTLVSNGYFGGTSFGTGPVRVLVANRGSLRHGRVVLGTTDTPGWFAIQTLWYARPGYGGAFVVRAARLGGGGPVPLPPPRPGLGLPSGQLVVPAGATLNTLDGYRTVPSSAWMRSGGCYAWQVDGRGFSETIVLDAQAP